MEGVAATGLSHRDGGDEEVPGKEGAQPQDEEADPDQVVAVGISEKVTPRPHAGRPLPPPRPSSGERTTTPITPAQQPRESADGNCSPIHLL